MAMPLVRRIRDRREFHPDLQLASVLLPSRLVGPRTLPVMQRLAMRLPGIRGTETHELGSGATVRVFRPSGSGDATAATTAAAPGPALVWMHGGGYLVGSAAQDDALCRAFARRTGAVVVSVDYRLAPQFPYPAALDDCHEALVWTAEQPDIDRDRIAVGGASAGGGLAAALAIRARDAGPVNPVLQLLAYPMLDDRTDTIDPRHRLWDARANRFGWSSYIGEAEPSTVAPARCPDLSGLAPAWIGVGTLDLFFDEDATYRERLESAGVPCEFLSIPGAFHGFDLVLRRAGVSRDFFEAQCAALRGAFG